MNAQTHDKTYHGWTNYETWTVNQWITNNPYTQQYWTNEAAQLWIDAELEQPHIRAVVASYKLSDHLRESFVERSPIQEYSVYFDLLNAALSEVNWDEIARSMISAMDKIEDTDDEGK